MEKRPFACAVMQVCILVTKTVVWRRRVASAGANCDDYAVNLYRLGED